MNIKKPITSVNQQYNALKNNYPFSSVTLQSASNKSLQSTVQPTIIKQFQNSNIDHTLSSKSTIPKNLPEKPKLQLSIVSNMTTVDSLNASHTQTKEKKQIIKQPRKLENNSMPLMGMFTNPNGIPHGELIINLLFLYFLFE